MLLFWVNHVWLLRLGLCFIICSTWYLLFGIKIEYVASWLVFSVCPLSSFSYGVSGGVMVFWLCVGSRTGVLFFRSFRDFVTLHLSWRSPYRSLVISVFRLFFWFSLPRWLLSGEAVWRGWGFRSTDEGSLEEEAFSFRCWSLLVLELCSRRFGSGSVPWTDSSDMFGLVLLCWPLHHLLSLVLDWFLARVPAVLWLVDLLLFSFSRIVYGFRCKSIVLFKWLM